MKNDIRFYALALLLSFFFALPFSSEVVAKTDSGNSEISKKIGNKVYVSSVDKIWCVDTKSATSEVVLKSNMGCFYHDIYRVKNNLYYVKAYTEPGYDETAICCYNLKNKKEKELCIGDDLRIYNNKIYYLSFDVDKDFDFFEKDKYKHSTGISTMNLDGSDNTIIIDNKHISKRNADFHIIEGKIYYLSNYDLMCATTKGNKIKKIYSSPDNYMEIHNYGGELYFGFYGKGESYEIYRYDVKKKSKDKFYSFNTTNRTDQSDEYFRQEVIFINNGTVYISKRNYEKNDTENNKVTGMLIKYNIASGKKEKINEVNDRYCDSIMDINKEYSLVGTYIPGDDEYGTDTISILDFKNNMFKDIDKWSIVP